MRLLLCVPWSPRLGLSKTITCRTVRIYGATSNFSTVKISIVVPAERVGLDASHAWLSVYIPDVGWMDFDPTNNQIPGEQHIIVAWGRGYGDVTPLKGVVFGGMDHELDVSVHVARLS
jgi:transglutaminase-like putative cysteine protease